MFQLRDGETSEILETAQAFIIFRKVGQRTLELKDVTQEIRSLIRLERVQATLTDMMKNASLPMDYEFFAAPPGSATARPQQAPQSRQPP